jgi:hypothetical protein
LLCGFGIDRNIDETPEDGPLAFLTLEPPLDVRPRECLEAQQTAPPAARTDRGIDAAERDGFRHSLHGHFSCGDRSNPDAGRKVRETRAFCAEPATAGDDLRPRTSNVKLRATDNAGEVPSLTSSR